LKRFATGASDAAVVVTVTVTLSALEPFSVTDAGDGVQADSVKLLGGPPNRQLTEIDALGVA
jgi:hypothetical protein